MKLVVFVGTNHSSRLPRDQELKRKHDLDKMFVYKVYLPFGLFTDIIVYVISNNRIHILYL